MRERILSDEETRQQMKDALGELMGVGAYRDFNGNLYLIIGESPHLIASDRYDNLYEVTLGGVGNQDYISDGKGGVCRVETSGPRQIHAHTLTPLKGEVLDEAIKNANLDYQLLMLGMDLFKAG